MKKLRAASLHPSPLYPDLAGDPDEEGGKRCFFQDDRIPRPGRAQARRDTVDLPDAAFLDLDPIAVATDPADAGDRRFQLVELLVVSGAEYAQLRQSEAEQAAPGLLDLLAIHHAYIAAVAGGKERGGGTVEAGQAARRIVDSAAGLEVCEQIWSIGV